MLRNLLFIVLILFSNNALAQCSEAQVGHWPYTDLITVPYNVSIGIVSTPSALPAGTYHFCGAYYVKAAAGINLATYHSDIGTDPNNIDSAPAGGTSNGHHVPIAGDDAGALTFVEPIGCRNLALDGNTKVYVHLISSFTPSSASVKTGAILNWCKML